MTSGQRNDAIGFAVIALGYAGYYFAVITERPGFGETLGLIMGLVIAMVVGMIVLHAAAALLLGKPAPERLSPLELDALRGRAARPGYGFMIAILWAVPFLLLLPFGEVIVAHTVVGIIGGAELLTHGWRLALRAKAGREGGTSFQNQPGLP